MSSFNLTIKLGNEAMQTPEDVADALEQTAHTLRRGRVAEATIRDTNGNTVGNWKLPHESPRV